MGAGRAELLQDGGRRTSVGGTCPPRHNNAGIWEIKLGRERQGVVQSLESRTTWTLVGRRTGAEPEKGDGDDRAAICLRCHYDSRREILLRSNI